MSFKQCLTQERLKEILQYNSETGEFSRHVPWKGTLKSGCLNPAGYIVISVDYQLYQASRLAFLYMTGEFPTQFIDHINMDRSDNRWENLRECSKGENSQNTTVKRHNKCGVKNVYWSNRDKKWVAEIRSAGRRISLGYHDALELAELVVQEAREKYHGGYARA